MTGQAGTSTGLAVAKKEGQVSTVFSSTRITQAE